MNVSSSAEYIVKSASVPNNIVGIPHINLTQLLAAVLPAAPPVILTKLWLTEIETIKTTFRKQLRNVVAVNGFWQNKITVGPAPGNIPAAIYLEEANEKGLTFKLPGSLAAFGLFVTTLCRKSFLVYNRATLMAEENSIKLQLNMAELTKLEQELSIVIEHLNTTDYIATLVQWQIKKRQLEKIAS